jgi:hypothetical protein
VPPLIVQPILKPNRLSRRPTNWDELKPPTLIFTWLEFTINGKIRRSPPGTRVVLERSEGLKEQDAHTENDRPAQSERESKA